MGVLVERDDVPVAMAPKKWFQGTTKKLRFSPPLKVNVERLLSLEATVRIGSIQPVR